MPNLHFGGPRRSARGKIGAADDATQPAANEGRRGHSPKRGLLEGSATVEAGGGAGNQPSRSRNNAAAHFVKLDPPTCRRVSSQSPFAASPARAVDPGRARSTPSARRRNDKPPAKARGDR